jgi:streptomycin 6-kinase
VRLNVPAEVRSKVVADGNAAWLNELPSVVESLARDWSLTIGATLGGGHAALVVEASLADETAAVLKIGVPGTRRDLGFEAAALRLADGDGCASLLRDDLDRDALLLERLGAALYDVVPDPATRHDMLCDVAARLWRPVGPDVDLPTGADKARQYADLLPQCGKKRDGRARRRPSTTRSDA